LTWSCRNEVSGRRIARTEAHCQPTLDQSANFCASSSKLSVTASLILCERRDKEFGTWRTSDWLPTEMVGEDSFNPGPSKGRGALADWPVSSSGDGIALVIGAIWSEWACGVITGTTAADSTLPKGERVAEPEAG
jgi:hypothetical protein